MICCFCFSSVAVCRMMKPVGSLKNTRKPLGRLSLSVSLFLSLSPDLKRAPRDNWQKKKSFQLIKAAAAFIAASWLHILPLRLIHWLKSYFFFHFTASCFVLCGSLLHSVERRGGRKKKTTKGNEGIKGRGMIYIKHNCYHFIFHQVSSCWREGGCPTSLLFLSDLIKEIVLPSSSEGSRMWVHVLILVTASDCIIYIVLDSCILSLFRFTNKNSPKMIQSSSIY